MIDKALEYSDNAGERERYLIKSLHASFAGDDEEALRILTEAASRYPDDKEIHFELSLVYGMELGDPNACIEHLKRVIDLDPLYSQAYNQLAYTYNEVGDFEKTIWAINQYISLEPDQPNPYDSRGDLYAYNGKLPEAMASYERAVEIEPDFWISIGKLGNMHLFQQDYGRARSCYARLLESPDAKIRSDGRLMLAYIPAYQGHFAEALEVLDDGLTADRMDGASGGPVATKHKLKAHLHLIRGETEAAIAEARLCLEVRERQIPLWAIYAKPLLVLTLARGGRFEEAESVAEDLKAQLEELGGEDLEWYWMVRGYIEWVRGDAATAAASLERIAEIDPSTAHYSRYALADAYLKLGRLADAVSELEKRLYRYDAYRAEIPTFVVRAHYLLGRAYEESGWYDRAAEQYDTFLEIWKDADPGIPEIEDARERMARLGKPS
jgi:tetratricopeptide (TPR) repeat protein